MGILYTMKKRVRDELMQAQNIEVFSFPSFLCHFLFAELQRHLNAGIIERRLKVKFDCVSVFESLDD